MPEGIEILDWAVLRAAAWPIEVAELFGAADLARSVDQVQGARRQLEQARAATVDALHDAVPKIVDDRARAWLLAMKRRVHKGTDPLPAVPAEHADHLCAVPGLAALIADERARRDEVAAREARLREWYRTELARQRRTLVALAGDARFGRALAIANPVVARLWCRQVNGLGPTDSRTKRLERTVFRYLMRAIGRPTPQGVWAGVTPVGPGTGERLRVTPSVARYTVDLDLAPFAAVVALLARQVRYRNDYPIRVNPTMHRADGAWWYERCSANASAEWVQLPENPLFTALIDACGDVGHVPGPLLDALASVSPRPERLRTLLAAALDQLLDRDAVLSALTFPMTADSPVRTLRSAAVHLVDPDRALWDSVVESAYHLCVQLAETFDDRTPGEVAAIVDGVRSHIARLLDSVGLTLPPDTPVIRVDMRLPYEVTWNADARWSARQVVRELMAVLAENGAAERFRVEATRGLASAATERDVGFLELARMLGTPHSFPRDWPSAWRGNGTAHVGAGPAGAVTFTVLDNGLMVGWGRPQPGLFVARFARLMDEPGGVVDELRGLVRGWSRHGVTAVEVVGADPVNPSAAVRPLLAHRHAAAHDSDMANLKVRFTAGRPWMYGSAGWLMPLYSSAALIGSRDSCSRALFQLAMGHGWELVSGGRPPTDADHRDEARLPGGGVLAPRTWILGEPVVRELAGLTGCDRYLAWRREACGLGLPDLVWAAPASDPHGKVLVPTSSPLAIDCLFHGTGPRAEDIVLSALPGNRADWPVQDAAGSHYLAELAVTWYDDGYWTTTTPT